VSAGEPGSSPPQRRPVFLPDSAADAPGDHSEATVQVIDAEVAAVIEAQGHRAMEILSGRHAVLDAAAARLLGEETLSGEELRAIAADRPALVEPAA
jgi:ATP-dependent Zn protease